MKHINHKTVFVSLLAFFLLVSFTHPLKKTKKVEEKPIATYLPMGGGEVIKPLPFTANSQFKKQSVGIITPAESQFANTTQNILVDSVANISSNNILDDRKEIEPLKPLPVKPISVLGIRKLDNLVAATKNVEEPTTQKEYYKYDSTTNKFEKFFDFIDSSSPLGAGGFDPVRFTLSSNKDSVSIGEEIEIKITADYLDVSPSLMFQFEGSNAFTLKMLLPEGFIQTGGTYYDYIQGKVDKTNPKQEFTIKGIFEAQSKEPCFYLLRSFAGAGVNDVWERKVGICLKNLENVSYQIPNFLYYSYSQLEACGCENFTDINCERRYVNAPMDATNAGETIYPDCWTPVGTIDTRVRQNGEENLYSIISGQGNTDNGQSVSFNIKVQNVKRENGGIETVAGFYRQTYNGGNGEYYESLSRNFVNCNGFTGNKIYKVKFSAAIGNKLNCTPFFRVTVGNVVKDFVLIDDNDFRIYEASFNLTEYNATNILVNIQALYRDNSTSAQAYLLLDDFRVYEDLGAPDPPTISASPDEISSGGSSELTGTCSSGTLTWDDNSTVSPRVVRPTVNTTYWAVCKNSSCASSRAETTVRVRADVATCGGTGPGSFSISVLSNATEYQCGVSVGETLYVSGFLTDGSNADEYQWYFDNGTTNTLIGTDAFLQITTSATYANSGTYKFLARKGNVWCEKSIQVIICSCRLQFTPSFTTTGNASAGTWTLYSNVPNCSNCTYLWTLPNAPNGNGQTLTEPNLTLTNEKRVNGRYYVTVKKGNNPDCEITKPLDVTGPQTPSYNGAVLNAFCNNISGNVIDYNNPGLQIPPLTLEIKKQTSSGLVSMPNESITVTPYGSFSRDWNPAYKDGSVYEVKVRFPAPNGSSMGPYQTSAALIQCCTLALSPTAEPIASCDANTNKGRYVVNLINHQTTNTLQYKLSKKTYNSNNVGAYVAVSPNWTIIPVGTAVPFLQFTDLERGFYQLEIIEGTNLNNQGCKIITNFTIDCEPIVTTACGTPPLITVIPDQILTEGGTITPTLFAEPIATSSGTSAGLSNVAYLSGTNSIQLGNQDGTNSNTFEAWIKAENNSDITVGYIGAGEKHKKLMQYWGVQHPFVNNLSVGSNGVTLIEDIPGKANARRIAISFNRKMTGWNHIALVYRNHIPEIYINGKLEGKATQSIYTIQNVQAADSYDTQLGYNQNLGFNGSVDEIRLWFSTLGSTSDLTAATISQNLKSRDNVPVISTGKYWAFEEPDPLKNVSGSNYDKLKFEGNVQVRATNTSDDKLPQSQDYKWYLNGTYLATKSFYTTLIDQLKPDSQTYVLHYTGDNGVDCQTSKTIKIRRCVSISPNTTQTVCEGTPVILTANATAGSTFTWYKVGKTTAIATTQTYAVPTSAEGDGIYYAKSSACTTESERVEIKHVVIAKPTASVTPNPATENSSATLKGNYIGDNGTPPIYLWTGPNNFVSSLQNPVLTNLSRTTNAGIYTLTITQTANNLTCNSTATTKLLINAANCGLNFGYDQECVGGLGKITIVVTGNTAGRTMLYSIDNGANWQASNVFTNLLNGDYDVSVRSYLSTIPSDQLTDADYCYITTQQVTITCAVTCSVLKKLNYDRWDNIEGTEINDFTATQLSAIFNRPKSESGFAPDGSGTGREPNFDIRNGTTQNFIARMHGFICPPVSGTYTFYMKADNSAKLFINGTQVIWVQDNPNNHDGEVSGTYTFPTANTQATIEVHHKQGISASFVMLSWKVGSSPKVLVSADYLSPTTTTVNPCQDFNFTLTTTPNRIPDKIVEGTEIKAIATATNGNTSGFKWTATDNALTIFDAPKGTTGVSEKTVATNIPVYLRPSLLTTETGQGPFERKYKVAFANAPAGCYQEITLNVIRQTCDCPTSDCDNIQILNPSLVTNFGTSENFVAETVYLDESASTGTQTVTYFDGLGRPKQKINIHAGPEQQDMVQPMEYDAFGRMPKNFLPYPVAGNNGNLVTTAIPNSKTWYGANKSSTVSFTESKFEESSFNRPEKISAVSKPILGNDLTKMVYGTNDGSILKFSVVYSTNAEGETIATVTKGLYDPNTLYKTEITDDNANSDTPVIPSLKTTEYKDNDGRVVCKDVGGLKTYYVYNDLGQLVCVLPPLATSNVPNTFTLFPTTSNNFSELLFQYAFNSRGLMAKKKVPGAVPVLMDYDTRDRLIETKDIRNSTSTTVYNLITTMTYDDLNRPKSTSVNEVEVIKNFYDSYNNIDTGYKLEKTLGNVPDGANITLDETNLKGMMVGSWIAIYKSDGTVGNKMPTTLYYDGKHRLVHTVTQNHTSTANNDYTTLALDFVGRAIASYTKITHSTGGDLITQTKNGYDFGGRTTAICQKISKNEYSEKWQPVAAYKYNDIGEMVEKTLGCRTQVVDYEHDIRGWLTKINNPAELKNTATKEYDFFGMSLIYTGDGNIKGQNYKNATTLAQFNDNGLYTDTYDLKQSELFTYNYNYDPLKRLKDADLTRAGVSKFTLDAMTYDDNGNIKTLKRTLAGIVKDNLAYNYNTANPNQLTSITDTGGDATKYAKPSTYTYNSDGSMLTDLGKLTNTGSIKYNAQNLAREIVTGNATYSYTYTATGQKLQMTDGTKTYDYIGNAVYLNNALEFASTAEGRWLPKEQLKAYNPNKTEANAAVFGRYEYQLKDHLGNTRAACRCVEKPAATLPEQAYLPLVVQESHYDPWGVNIEKDVVAYPLKLPIFDPIDRFAYNGKEKQGTLDWLDYGARMYDPTVGRWGVIDPLTEFSYSLTGYRYGFNNPIKFTDLMGLWEKTSNGYSTTDVDEIERFLTFKTLDKDKSMKNTFHFIDGEMKGGGQLSDGSRVLTGINIYVANTRFYTDEKTFDRTWHEVQGSLTPDELDYRTLHKNILGYTYPGPNNPKKYNGNDDYSYKPSLPIEYPGMIHDLAYDKKQARGALDLLTNESVIDDDIKFVYMHYILASYPTLDFKTRVHSIILAEGLNFISTPKRMWKDLKHGLKALGKGASNIKN